MWVKPTLFLSALVLDYTNSQFKKYLKTIL